MECGELERELTKYCPKSCCLPSRLVYNISRPRTARHNVSLIHLYGLMNDVMRGVPHVHRKPHCCPKCSHQKGKACKSCTKPQCLKHRPANQLVDEAIRNLRFMPFLDDQELTYPIFLAPKPFVITPRYFVHRVCRYSVSCLVMFLVRQESRQHTRIAQICGCFVVLTHRLV